MKKSNKNKVNSSPGADPLYIKSSEDIDNYSLPDNNFVQRSYASSSSSVNVRPGFSKEDILRHREEERLPKDHQNIIKVCQSLYKKNGLIRNLIDLMADFASEGIDIQHTNKKQQKFYRSWAKKVKLDEKAHDFMRNLLRDGNVIVYKKNAKLSKSVMKQILSEAKANKDEDVIKLFKERDSTRPMEIPWVYTFISPSIAKKTSGELGRFYGSDEIGICVNQSLMSAIKNPKTQSDKEIVSRLPKEIVDAAKSSNSFTVIPLNPDRTYVAYYKKDDWEDWGTPFLYGIIEDVLFKDKMKQADMAALDGIINMIRVWKLGKSDKEILPTKTAVNKLISILENNVGGGVMDIVWDDMIDLQTEYPPVDKILGDAKYKSVNSDIVRGLGIPDALVGGSESGSRNTQHVFVQLKTLMQRLNYVRSLALAWLNEEVELVAKAMGFRTPPRIIFGNMSLRDEAAEKKLLIQLLDRGVISVETVLNNFGRDFLIELERLKDEEITRQYITPVIERAGPFYRPLSVMETQFKYSKELKSNDGGENISGDLPRDEETDKEVGRPPGTKDSEPRKTRETTVMSNIEYAINHTKASSFMSKIDEIIDPSFLKSVNGVSNKRKLSVEQRDILENTKWVILCSISPSDDLSDEKIIKFVENADIKVINKINNIYKSILSKYMADASSMPTYATRRDLMMSAWSIFYSTISK